MSARATRILVVDDEPQIRRFLRATLGSHGYSVVEASLGQQALSCVTREHPDLVILDLGLPDVDGAEIISRIREGSNVPIIVLSVRQSEFDKIDAFDRGADDYLTKPFGAGELLARIRATLRHGLQSLIDTPIFRCGGLKVNLAGRRVCLDGKPVILTPKEYEILHHLVINAGRVVTHQHLLREVWSPQQIGGTSNLRVCISALRRKIEPDRNNPRYILTEPGIGYRLRTNDGKAIGTPLDPVMPRTPPS